MLPHCGTAISIHAPREGGDHPIPKNSGKTIISIHAPREGGRHGQSTCATITITFQSTPPARGATPPPDAVQLLSFSPISIHAPREGGDICVVDWCTQHQNFNPRPPRGGRPYRRVPVHRCSVISIHAPREGGDGSNKRQAPLTLTFQSTPPARGATAPAPWAGCRTSDFNPRPPRGGRRPLFL